MGWFYSFSDYSVPLPAGASLDFHVGYNFVDDKGANDFESLFGDDKYIDWCFRR